MIDQTQRLIPENTQHSQETDFNVPGGIQTSPPSKQEAADPRLRPRGIKKYNKLPAFHFILLSLSNRKVWGLVKALAIGRTVTGSIPVVSLDFSVTYSFRLYPGPGVDSAPSENEYHEHFLGVKAVGA